MLPGQQLCITLPAEFTNKYSNTYTDYEHLRRFKIRHDLTAELNGGPPDPDVTEERFWVDFYVLPRRRKSTVEFRGDKGRPPYHGEIIRFLHTNVTRSDYVTISDFKVKVDTVEIGVARVGKEGFFTRRSKSENFGTMLVTLITTASGRYNRSLLLPPKIPWHVLPVNYDETETM